MFHGWDLTGSRPRQDAIRATLFPAFSVPFRLDPQKCADDSIYQGMANNDRNRPKRT